MEQDTGSGVDPAELAGAELADAKLAEAAWYERQADTGEPRVDGAIRQLRELDELPVSEHPQVFERIHGQLVDVLGELHSGTGAGTSSGTDAGTDAGTGYGTGSGEADRAAR